MERHCDLMDWVHLILGRCLKRGGSQVPSVEISPLPLSLLLHSLPHLFPFPLWSFWVFGCFVLSELQLALLPRGLRLLGVWCHPAEGALGADLGMTMENSGRARRTASFTKGWLCTIWVSRWPKAQLIGPPWIVWKKILLVVFTKLSEDRMFQFYIQEEGVGN